MSKTLFLSENCNQLREKFLSPDLSSLYDLADFLKVDFRHLNYYIYKIPTSLKYKSLSIKKKSGDYREILIPHPSLKIIQRKLSQVLYAIYQPKPCVHGFAVQRSIVTNARVHTNKEFVLNIDLENFFGSINFGRVRGLFIAPPYRMNQSIATIIAQICCHENILPQGAPTSPIISNLICQKLDNELLRFAKKNQLFYTRYADDITFSYVRDILPEALVKSYSKNYSNVVLGDEITSLILGNGFSINYNKVRLSPKTQSQQVTGLVVNKFVNVNREYIRNLYSIFHAWKKFGLDSVRNTYYEKYAKVSMIDCERQLDFIEFVRGKIEFVGSVRGKDSTIYQKLMNSFQECTKSE